jgi:hypothetical protein
MTSPGNGNGSTNGNGHESSHLGWWLALAAAVPIGLSLLALGRLRARRDPILDEYEAWWQARAAAREAGVPMPVPPAKSPSLFV